MSFRIVHPDQVPQGEGPHPAASPFDRRMSEALGVTAFEVYHVDLPPDARSVDHDHVDDDNDDVYVVLAGDGRLVVDGESVAISAGQFVAVEQHHRRHLVAGPAGLRLVAMCGPSHRGNTARTDTDSIRPVERTLVHDSGEDDLVVPGSSVGVDVGGPLAALGVGEPVVVDRVRLEIELSSFSGSSAGLIVYDGDFEPPEQARVSAAGLDAGDVVTEEVEVEPSMADVVSLTNVGVASYRVRVFLLGWYPWDEPDREQVSRGDLGPAYTTEEELSSPMSLLEADDDGDEEEDEESDRSPQGYDPVERTLVYDSEPRGPFSPGTTDEADLAPHLDAWGMTGSRNLDWLRVEVELSSFAGDGDAAEVMLYHPDREPFDGPRVRASSPTEGDVVREEVEVDPGIDDTLALTNLGASAVRVRVFVVGCAWWDED